MKAPLLIKTAGVSVGLFASLLFSINAVAGPGPQFWAQQDAARPHSNVTKQSVVSSATAAEPAAPACDACKTSKIEAFSGTNVSGKIAPHQTTIGTKHECAVCKGEIATVHGRTTNRMQHNCPAHAGMNAANVACCDAGN